MPYSIGRAHVFFWSRFSCDVSDFAHPVCFLSLYLSLKRVFSPTRSYDFDVWRGRPTR